MTQSDLHSNAVGGLSLEARVDEIVLFHNDFPPSGEQPEQRISAHKL